MNFYFYAFLIAEAIGETCRAVSFEGGGSHGAYEAGAFYTLVNTLNAADVAYDIVTGISTGALNAGALAQFAKGNEKAAGEFLVNTWLTIDGSQYVFVDWPGGLAQGILFEPGLYNTATLKNMINTKLNKGINRKVTVGSTNLDTGEFINFDESLGSEFLEAIMCSASPPFIFPFQSFQGQSYADGGCLINLDVFQAITRCYEETNNYADIIVDLIFDTKISSLPVSFTFNTIDVMSRVNQISSYNSAIWYYNQAKLAYPKVQFRYVIIPTGDMPGGIVPLNFTQSVLEAEVSMGKTDAANKIKSGENGRDTIERLYQQVKFNIITP